MKTINILVLYPNENDATSLYRGVGPLSKIHKTGERHGFNIQIFKESKFTWASVAKADIAFMQRPFGKMFYDGAMILKESGIPIWLDYDDNLFYEDIPDYNPAKWFFGNPEDQQPFIDLIKVADVISVTSPALQEKIQKYNDKIVIIPNGHDDYRFKFEKKFSDRGIVNWRGSNTHLGDLLEVEDALVKIKEKNPEWVFNFIGSDADKLTKLECHRTPSMDPIKYFNTIKKIHPRIQIVPLANNKFNKSKSNIGWIEGVYSGAVAIAPRYMPEFVRPGCINYDTLEEFESLLDRAIKDGPWAQKNYEKSFQYIQENLLLSELNEKRFEIIQKLANV